MSTTLPLSAIILFAHGSRDPLWSKPIEAIAHRVAQASPHCVVRCAYLELMLPNLETVVAEMALKDIQHIRIAPMFWALASTPEKICPKLPLPCNLTTRTSNSI